MKSTQKIAMQNKAKRWQILNVVRSRLGKEIFLANGASLVVRLMAVMASTISSITLARVLGVEQYGLYAFIFAVISLLIFPAQLGIPTLVVRETARSASLAEWRKMKGLWVWSLSVISISAAVVILLISLVNYLLDHLVSVERSHALVAALPLILVLSIARIPAAALRGLRRVFLGQVSDRVLRPAFLAVFVVISAVWTNQADATTALKLHVVAGTITVVLSFIILRCVAPRQLVGLVDLLYERTLWLRAVVPLTLITGLQLLHQSVDVLMLGLISTDIAVAFYKISVSLATLVAFGLTAINMAVQPYIADFYASAKIDRLQRLASFSAIGAFLLSAPIILLFVFFGEKMIGIVFGSDYTPAHTTLIILALGQAANAYFGVVGALLVMTGHEHANLRALVTTLVLNICLNAVLIPLYLAVGAAIATATSMVVWNFLYWRSAKRLIGVSSTPLGAFNLKRS